MYVDKEYRQIEYFRFSLIISNISYNDIDIMSANVN